MEYRPCDLEARDRLRPVGRAGTVFTPPARYMLEAAGNYTAIRQLVDREREANPKAKGISAQAAAIAPKVKQVDDWVRAHPDSEAWLYECHPELSWYALSRGAQMLNKHSASGLVRRLSLLRDHFHDAEERIAESEWVGRQATLSDMLDAYAALSTALVLVHGEEKVLGNHERDDEDVLMRMVM